MIGKIWVFAVCASCGYALFSGRSAEAAEALMASGGQAVTLMLELMGAMTLWSGVMEQLSESGDLVRMGKGIRRLMRPLFPQVEDEEAWSAAGMNVAANLFGLGNAATPAGVRAAELLSRQGEDGIRALAMLLAVNNSGLQLMPTTVIMLRSAAGAAQAADIWLPTLLSSGAATITTLGLMLLLNRRREAGCKG